MVMIIIPRTGVLLTGIGLLLVLGITVSGCNKQEPTESEEIPRNVRVLELAPGVTFEEVESKTGAPILPPA